MMEKCLKNNKLVIVILLCNACTNTSCAIQTAHFISMPVLSGRICIDTGRIFQVHVKSKLMCSKICDTDPECAGIFYEPVDRTCTTCRGKNNLIEKSGTLCYIKDVSCGSLPSVSGVEITAVSGYAMGDQASYKCTSCSYSPANGVGIITCQVDGTWTTPSCAPAIDVGFLPDGQVIPNGAIGCVETGGATCLSSSFSAHVSNGLRSDGDTAECWCGPLCCNPGYFCCYDVKC